MDKTNLISTDLSLLHACHMAQRYVGHIAAAHPGVEHTTRVRCHVHMMCSMVACRWVWMLQRAGNECTLYTNFIVFGHVKVLLTQCLMLTKLP